MIISKFNCQSILGGVFGGSFSHPVICHAIPGVINHQHKLSGAAALTEPPPPPALLPLVWDEDHPMTCKWLIE